MDKRKLKEHEIHERFKKLPENIYELFKQDIPTKHRTKGEGNNYVSIIFPINGRYEVYMPTGVDYPEQFNTLEEAIKAGDILYDNAIEVYGR